jgi:serine protease Do
MPSLREKGRVVRGYIGTLLQPLTPELSAALKLQEDSGALVGEVAPKSPAEKAGIKSGDVITEVNGKKIMDARELRMLVGAMAPGTKAKIQVVREDGKKTFVVDLIEMPTEQSESAAASDQNRPPQVAKFFGVLVADLNDEVRQALSVPKDIEGAVIVGIDPTSAAAQAGLRKGDVIRELNKHTVKNARELVAGAQVLKGGEKLLLQIWSEGKSGYVALEPQ